MLSASLFLQIFATDKAENTEPCIGDRRWWPRVSTVMYPIFIDRRKLLCNVLHMKTTCMAIKPRVFKIVYFKEFLIDR